MARDCPAQDFSTVTEENTRKSAIPIGASTAPHRLGTSAKNRLAPSTPSASRILAPSIPSVRWAATLDRGMSPGRVAEHRDVEEAFERK